MFEWKVEDMILLNEKGKTCIGKKQIFDCESKVSREDKIAFVDSFQDGKLSYLLELIEKFNNEKETMPKNGWGGIKTVSLKAWIKRNDKRYKYPIINDYYSYGDYNILEMRRNIEYNTKGGYDIYDDLVDELFHRQLKECKKQEYIYFLEHNEYSILKEKFRNRKYSTTFGVHIATCSDGNIYIYDGEKKDYYESNKREITIDELKILLSKYEEMEKLEEKITKEITIKF